MRRRLDPAAEDGQVMILSIAYAMLALLLVTAVASASSVHLERKRLLALADTAALAAASALDEDAYYGRSGASAVTPLVLTDGSVRQAVDAHLEDAPGTVRLTDLTVVDASTPDGRTAEVTLGALSRPPLISWVTALWSDGIRLEVTARARAG